LSLKLLRRLSEKVVSGTTAVLKNPVLPFGLMAASLLLKRFATPNREGRSR